MGIGRVRTGTTASVPAGAIGRTVSSATPLIFPGVAGIPDDVVDFGCDFLPEPAKTICKAALGGGGVALPELPGGGGSGGNGGNCQDGSLGPFCPDDDDFVPPVGPPTNIPTGGTAMVPTAAGGHLHHRPTLRAVSRWQCPKFMNGVGILWKDINGAVTCLPRGTSGVPLGLVRKNTPAGKPLVSAGDARVLRKADQLEKRFRKNKALKSLMRGR